MHILSIRYGCKQTCLLGLSDSKRDDSGFDPNSGKNIEYFFKLYAVIRSRAKGTWKPGIKILRSY